MDVMDRVRVWNDSQMAELADKLTDSLPDVEPDGPAIPDRLVQVSLKNLGMKSAKNDPPPIEAIDPLEESVDLAVSLARKIRSSAFIVRSVSISHDRSVTIEVT